MHRALRALPSVVEEVCLPLDMFRSSRELVPVVDDTITGVFMPSIVLLLGLKDHS